MSRQIEQELSQPEEQYQYPPITLLDQGTAGSFTEAGAEMRSNSKRLADTLRSFGVGRPARRGGTGVPASPDMNLPSPRGEAV